MPRSRAGTRALAAGEARLEPPRAVEAQSGHDVDTDVDQADGFLVGIHVHGCDRDAGLGAGSDDGACSGEQLLAGLKLTGAGK